MMSFLGTAYVVVKLIGATAGMIYACVKLYRLRKLGKTK